MPKAFKGEKYIYLLMAIRLCQQYKLTPVDKACKEPTFTAIIGNDNNMVGGQNYYRYFKLWKSSYDDRWILQETKTSKACADFSRYFEVLYPEEIKPVIKEYYNEHGENCSTRWEH